MTSIAPIQKSSLHKMVIGTLLCSADDYNSILERLVGCRFCLGAACVNMAIAPLPREKFGCMFAEAITSAHKNAIWTSPISVRKSQRPMRVRISCRGPIRAARTAIVCSSALLLALGESAAIATAPLFG
jgi:hypothetical protein